MKAIELKHCPFCGGKAKGILYSWGGLPNHDISCTKPKCYAYREPWEARFKNPNDAVEAWNRRAEK